MPPTESQVLQSFLQKVPEEDAATDVATDAQEESVGVTPDDSDTKELDDGGALIRIADEKSEREAAEFYVNLAEDMSESDLNSISTKLLDLIEKDKEARKKRDEQYEEGIRRTGLAHDAPGGASFDGASKVVHPLMIEVSIDFAARSIKELWPAQGPVKDKVIGEPSAKKDAKAKRKTRYMNWQLTEKMPSVRYEIEQILTQVPLGGAAYSKLWYDPRRKKPVHEPVWIDSILLPWAATDYYSSDRKTHVQDINQYTFADRIRSGMYRDIDSIAIVTDPDQTRAAKANDKVEGKSQTSYNEDGVRRVFEIAVQYVIADDARGVDDPEDTEAGPAPYLISIDESTRSVLSIYRNWDENDENEEELVHIIEWPFLPWRGAMPIGTPQVLGGIAAASTGALRALLDSAHINNFPGGVRLKSGPMGGQSIRVEAGQTSEIDGGIMQDDVRKTYMPVPVNPTSPVLFELLGYLVDAGKEIVKTTLDEANDNANVPVGTTMARIEQGMVVFSAIHSRLHNSMGKLLKVLHRLNATYLSDDQVVKETGEKMTFKADFDAPDDVVPVSDPEIFSELQRVAQVQTVAQRAQLFPALYDQRQVEESILEMMKIKNPTKYLKPKPEPKPLNAVNENIAVSLGQPIVAFPDQDHLGHIQEHLTFLEDPMFGANPLIAPQAIPGILQNVKEHMLFWYGTEIHRVASQAAGQDISLFMQIKDAELQTKFDGMLAAAGSVVHKSAQTMFQQVPDVIRKAQAMLQQFQPPQPMDPSQVAQQKVQADSQAKQADTQVKQQAQQAKTQADAQALQLEAQKLAQDHAIQQATLAQSGQTDAAKMQLEKVNRDSENQTQLTQVGIQAQSHIQGVQETNATKLEVTAQDNRVAEEIAGAEIEAGRHTNIKNGQAVGKSKE